MLIDFDVDRISELPTIVGPDIALPETHAIERLARQAGSRVGELLGVAEYAAQSLDDARLAANVIGRPDMPQGIGGAHGDAVAGLKTRLDRIRARHRRAPPPRRSCG